MYIAVLSVGGGNQWTLYEWEQSLISVALIRLRCRYGSATTAHHLKVKSINYGPMDNTSVGGTVGAENGAGTVGMSYFYNGAGTAPVEGDELLVQTLNGGSATLGFQVVADCDADAVVNRGELSNDGGDEAAIAVTQCQ